MGDSDRGGGGEHHLVLVARKPGFDLPTACPSCLPVYLYLKLSNTPFTFQFNSSFPDSDHIPYVEYGENVALNNERGGVIEMLKENAIIDLNAKHTSLAIHDLVSGEIEAPSNFVMLLMVLVPVSLFFVVVMHKRTSKLKI